MIHQFHTCLLNSNDTIMTQVVEGTKGIIVDDEKQTYEYEEIIKIVDKSYHMERRQYGWDVKFVDNGQKKKLFIREWFGKKCNDSTRHDQTIYEWIDYLYDRGNQQLNLF